MRWHSTTSGTLGASAATRRFRAGVLLLWLNPKAWAVTLSAAAAFAGSVDGPVRLAALLGAAFAACGTFSQLLWCGLGGVVARLLTRAWQWRALNVTLAVLVVASVVPMWLHG